jgi:6-phosphogluconate dehydrogenase
MEIGIVGLGRMGAGLAQRLRRAHHRVVGYDPQPEAAEALAASGVEQAADLAALVGALSPPRALWVMVPSGAVTDDTLERLAGLLEAGDVVVNGGNSFFRESMAWAERLAGEGVSLLDAGTSGGVWGLEQGFCLMVGGDARAFRRLEPVFAALAPERGYAHVGPSGAGHFTKMVHNGIEYGLMQAYGEGFELLEASDFDLDLGQVAELWRHGSVVRSWLLDLAARAYADDPELASLRGHVEDSGEGRWTVAESLELRVPAPVIALALQMRFRSRQDESYAGKLVAALRREFGGHAVQDD